MYTYSRKVFTTDRHSQETQRRKREYEELENIILWKRDEDAAGLLNFSKKKLYRQFRQAFVTAYHAHSEQQDKAGEPYIYHPVQAALYIRDHAVPSAKRDRAMIAALLHDTLEDTEMTAEELLERGFSEKVVKTVVRVSRAPEESYEVYMQRVMESSVAMMVKCGDMADNEKIFRMPFPGQKERWRAARYRSYRLTMESCLRESGYFPEEEE